MIGPNGLRFPGQETLIELIQADGVRVVQLYLGTPHVECGGGELMPLDWRGHSRLPRPAGDRDVMNLLTHVTLSLEREVSFERVHAFKSVAIIAAGTLAGAITAASTLNQDQASDLIIGVIAMTAPLWQAGHIGIDFEPTLTRLITALIDGMTHGSSAG